MNKREFNEKTDQITLITEEIAKLGEHIKTYSVGAFPVFYLQLHSVLKVQDILSMHLHDIYSCDEGNVHVRKEIAWEGQTVVLIEESRREMAWYAMQRIKVRNAKAQQLKEQYLCINKQGKPLQKQVYRKMLERASSEIGLSRVYNSSYLRNLYGYLEIAYGNKTVDDVAEEYQVERYYLLNRMFKGMEITYDKSLLDEVAGIVGGGILDACEEEMRA